MSGHPRALGPAAAAAAGAGSFLAFVLATTMLGALPAGATGTDPSTTTITSLTTSPVVGQPIAVAVQVTGSTPGPGSLTPSGSVTVTDGTNSCQALLGGADGVAGGSCQLIELTPSSYGFSASYGGDVNFAFSQTSAPDEATVGEAATTTIVTPASQSVVVGQPDVVGVQVVGAFPAAGLAAPSGSVTVSGGAGASCQARLSGTDGVSTGRCSIAESVVGSFQISASFGGDANFSAGTSSPVSESVSIASSETSLSVTAAKPVYGHEQLVKLSVRVSPRYTGSPSGPVTVLFGKTKLCSLSLVGGAARCQLGATALPAGTSGIVASYGGSTSFRPSSSALTHVIVAKATSKTTLSLSPGLVVAGKEHGVRLTVVLAPQFPAAMTGTVTLKAAKTTLCTIKKLSKNKGTCSPSAKALAKGSYSVTASYAGSADFDPSHSAAKPLKVT